MITQVLSNINQHILDVYKPNLQLQLFNMDVFQRHTFKFPSDILKSIFVHFNNTKCQH